MSEQASQHRRAQRGVLIGLGLVVVLAGVAVIARRSLVHPQTEEPPEVTLNAAVSCSGGEVQVTNNDTATWMDARVEIDSKYARVITAIPAGQTVTLTGAQLSDSSGNRFNPLSMKCESADIQAFLRHGRGHFSSVNLH